MSRPACIGTFAPVRLTTTIVVTPPALFAARSVFAFSGTALRALMREGDAPVQRTSRKSLRLLGSVGEPINPEAWLWYHRVVGEGRCPIVDTW